MKGFLEDEALEREPPRDTELTLGSGTLLAVFFALVAICGLCFGMGYALGARGSKGPVFQNQGPAAGPAQQLPADSPQGKPSAMAAASAPPAVQTAANGTPAAPGPAAPGASNTPAIAAGTPPVQQPQDGGWHPVQSAMPGAPNAAPATQPAPAATVQPAMPGQNALMVQIAAVSNPEDASVLVGALRKRGYNVSATRNPGDNLIHVCIGPFSNANDANSMRQRLLNDGYNAIVLP